eukprot:829612-Pleurochrysis_carterae.AAC.3
MCCTPCGAARCCPRAPPPIATACVRAERARTLNALRKERRVEGGCMASVANQRVVGNCCQLLATVANYWVVGNSCQLTGGWHQLPTIGWLATVANYWVVGISCQLSG